MTALSITSSACAGAQLPSVEPPASAPARSGAPAAHAPAPVSQGLVGFEFTVAEREGKRALLVGDRQHEYVFLEAAGPGRKAPRKR